MQASYQQHLDTNMRPRQSESEQRKADYEEQRMREIMEEELRLMRQRAAE